MFLQVLICALIAFCGAVTPSVPINFYTEFFTPTRAYTGLGNSVSYLQNVVSTRGARSVFQIGRHQKNNIYFFNYAQFFLDGSSGGYVGLQVEPNNNYKVVFSLWDADQATDGPDSVCSPFGGEGMGQHCLIKGFNLKLGFIYFLDVELHNGTLWAYISDAQTTMEYQGQPLNRSLIGGIGIPYGNASTFQMTNYITEMYIAQPTCNDIPAITATVYPTSQYTLLGSLEDYSVTFFDADKAYPYGTNCESFNYDITCNENQCTYRAYNMQ